MGEVPLMAMLFLASFLVVVFRSKQNRFLVAWVFVTVALVLNPLVSPYVMRYLTTENIYWRLFYLLPFPLIVALGMLALFRKDVFFRVYSPLVIPMFGILGLLIDTAPTSILNHAGGATIGWPTYKLTPVAR